MSVYLNMCSDSFEMFDLLHRCIDLVKDDFGELKERLRVGASIARHRHAEGVCVPEVHIDGADVTDELLRLELKFVEIFHLQILLFRPNLRMGKNDCKHGIQAAVAIVITMYSSKTFNSILFPGDLHCSYSEET